MAYTPPSDFNTPDEGFPWGRVILGTGGGCLIFVFVVISLTTWGTCKAGKGCCDNIEEAHKKQLRPAQSFVDAVGSGDYTTAYNKTSEPYQARTSESEFAAFIEGEGALLKGGEVKFVAVHSSAKPPHYLYLSVDILDPATRTSKGIVTFAFSRRRPRGPRDTVEDIQLGIPKQKMSQDDVEHALKGWVGHVQRGQHREAYMLMDQTFQRDVDLQAFTAFVEREAVLKQGVPIIETFHVKNREAEVQVAMKRGDVTHGRVYFSLVETFGAWKVMSFRTESTSSQSPIDLPGFGPNGALAPKADAGSSDVGLDSAKEP